ncbi:hypothetical protein [Paraburkholderia fynbosensis]|uniref:Uncharacterized protein n=1 Tax=Paraburkholderia fynbosensis TaxID=1200993 RepID=A0A6J5GEH2_9BURK|nr:hypothetical protein [Paraburkholderia fynbosensis]CAB3797751.1 hypothetical protein LMG27177_04304 [Paraburkholderia fynbosensis]
MKRGLVPGIIVALVLRAPVSSLADGRVRTASIELGEAGAVLDLCAADLSRVTCAAIGCNAQQVGCTDSLHPQIDGVASRLDDSDERHLKYRGER